MYMVITNVWLKFHDKGGSVVTGGWLKLVSSLWLCKEKKPVSFFLVMAQTITPTIDISVIITTMTTNIVRMNQDGIVARHSSDCRTTLL